jgi:hypothetical protein
MNRIGKTAAGLAFLLVAGCDNVTVNNKAIDLDNHIDAAASGIENIAEDAANAADRAGEAIENRAEALGNHVDINVDLDGRDNKADGNSH